MLNRWVRYLPLRDLLNNSDAGLILEVGSGSLGLGEFFGKPFVGCDVSFDPKTFSSFILPVCASGTRLPFRDRTFGVVLCLDTMEHVPREFRPPFVRELLRVTRSVLILGAPMEEKAALADRRLHDYFQSKGLKEPSWLQEHMDLIREFPRRQEFVEMFEEGDIPFQVRRGESAWFHRVITILEHKSFMGRVTGKLSRHPWRILASPFLRLMNFTSSYRTYLIAQK